MYHTIFNITITITTTTTSQQQHHQNDITTTTITSTQLTTGVGGSIGLQPLAKGHGIVALEVTISRIIASHDSSCCEFLMGGT